MSLPATYIMLANIYIMLALCIPTKGKLTDRGGCDINDTGCGDCNGRGNRKCIITLYFRSALDNHAFSSSPEFV